MRAKRLGRVISQFGKVLERTIKVQIGGLNANFDILNKGVYIFDDKLRYVVLKLQKK